MNKQPMIIIPEKTVCKAVRNIHSSIMRQQNALLEYHAYKLAERQNCFCYILRYFLGLPITNPSKEQVKQAAWDICNNKNKKMQKIHAQILAYPKKKCDMMTRFSKENIFAILRWVQSVPKDYNRLAVSVKDASILFIYHE